MFKENVLQNKNMADCLFLGADIHKNNHTFLALNAFGQRIGSCASSDEAEDLHNLKIWIESLRANYKRKVILGLEDSCGNGEKIARFLVSCGYPVYGINPCLTAQRRARTIHQDKSDEVDALLVAKILISEIDSLPKIEINEQFETAKELKGTVDDYDALVKTQTRLKNQLHRLLYQHYGTDYHQLFKSPFSQKALSFWLREACLNNNERGCEKSLDPYSGLATAVSQLKDSKKLRLRQKVEHLLFIQEKLKNLAKIMEKVFSSLPYHSLLTLPGCGTLLACRIVGEIKDIKRFSSSDKLAKYSGLAPKNCSSGRSNKYRSSKSGNRQLNKAFYRIALSQIGNRGKDENRNYYLGKIKAGKSKKQSLRLLARKNVDIVYAIMRDQVEYVERKT